MEPNETKVHVGQTVEAFILGGQGPGLSLLGVHPCGRAVSLGVMRCRTI